LQLTKINGRCQVVVEFFFDKDPPFFFVIL
jgi:hypothetical protein